MVAKTNTDNRKNTAFVVLFFFLLTKSILTNKITDHLNFDAHGSFDRIKPCQKINYLD